MGLLPKAWKPNLMLSTLPASANLICRAAMTATEFESQITKDSFHGFTPLFSSRESRTHTYAMLPRGIISTSLPALVLKPAVAPPRNAAAITSKYSITDEDLESRGFFLRRTIADLNLDHLNSVFVAVGFPRRDPQKIRLALENTHSLLWIQHKETERPVAFARANGDGVFNAIIWDVVVDPSFQGIGLGKAVMERLMEELLDKGIVNIALYSEPRVIGFYRPLGFVSDPDGIKGMVYSRKPKRKK